MPELPATPRPSSAETLKDLYLSQTGDTKQTLGVPGLTGAIRAHIKGRNGTVQAWNMGKRAGVQGGVNPLTLTPHSQMGPFSVDAINGSPEGITTRDWAQRNFVPFQPKVTMFTAAGLDYAKNLGLKRDRYK
jgi:hypothetical protein